MRFLIHVFVLFCVLHCISAFFTLRSCPTLMLSNSRDLCQSVGFRVTTWPAFRTLPRTHLSAKKKASGKKKRSDSLSQREEEEPPARTVEAGEKLEEALPLPLGTRLESTEAAGSKFVRDRSLDSLIIEEPKGQRLDAKRGGASNRPLLEIPKEAVVQDPVLRRKSAEAEADDEDAAFGLPGNVMRALKTGTWACIALLVGAEIFARTPLSTALKGGVDEVAVLRERKGQATGVAKELPGIRPFPSFYDLETNTPPPTSPPSSPAPAPATPAKSPSAAAPSSLTSSPSPAASAGPKATAPYTKAQ